MQPPATAIVPIPTLKHEKKLGLLPARFPLWLEASCSMHFMENCATSKRRRQGNKGVNLERNRPRKLIARATGGAIIVALR